jgi:hypothetical protein
MNAETTVDAWVDMQRETHPLERVERYEPSGDYPGGWEISFDRCLTTIISDEYNGDGVVPYVGAQYTYWGRGFGSRHRGQAINGRVLWYLTEEEDAAKFHAEVEASQAKRRAEWEAGKDEYFARIAALPEIFRERIALRQRNNPDFDWEYGGYEVFCCEQAVLMAEAFRTRWPGKSGDDLNEAIRRFHDESWDEQRSAVPGLSEDHSGNTFGASVALANHYLQAPEGIPHVRGALSPLVGSCAYGDVPPEHEFCRDKDIST